MSKALDTAIREARQDLGTREAKDVHWEAVDEALFARLAQERRVEAMRSVGLRSPAWVVGAGAMAAAACFALVAGTLRTTSPVLETPVVVAAPTAGNVIALQGGGELLVDGKPSGIGTVLRLGDVVEARGTSATVERPGKLTMQLEAGSRARVTHVQGALVLALETGAVEAQVVPVASGEAFAVDVGTSRVAVHGTHLRVERDDRDGAEAHVRVDLTEGVVIVGVAPREGSTVGTLVTAPAHADFVAGDAPRDLLVSHEAEKIRPAIAFGAGAPPALAREVVPPPPRPIDPPAPAAPLGMIGRHPPTPAASPAPPPPPQPDPAAPTILASAVRSCMAARPSAENVTVVVSTTLHMDLDADGNVKAARFDPPVAADVNACAAPVIYRTRFTHGGSADVTVDFKVPSSAP